MKTMILILIFLSLSSWAATPQQWNTILSVTEQHEFYKNLEPIIKPKDSWQHIFSLSYTDSDLNTFKDCVFFRVPGVDSGVLKIKTISPSEKCDKHLMNPGDLEVNNIKSLQYAIFEKKLTVDITYIDLKSDKWIGYIQSSFLRPEARAQLSSAEFKSPKLIILAPKANIKAPEKKPFLKNKTLCFDVNEDCEAKAPSICDQCENGWYEVPNGCTSGPKYCGRLECGGKDQPACRRGMKWQKKESQFECRIDSSFAYCSKGLSVQCDGKKAFCR